ncbi:MAG: MFS transporter, partial [Lachnospiraceae bacterium]|nr:MFS transporter [Lachnospiraceae bacterium]
YTMHDISYWGMVPALGSDAGARDQFTSRATLFAGVGGTLASILIPMLTTGESAIGGNASTAYSVIALVVCVLAPLFLCFTLFGVREHRADGPKKPFSLGLGKVVKTIMGNDQLMWISLIFLIQQIGNGLVVGGIGSTYIYFTYGYEGGLYSVFTTIGMAATAFLMIFYPAISRKIHRKQLMSIMMAVSTVGYVLMLVSGLAFSGSDLGFWVLVVGYMLSNFGQYGFYLVMMISIINTVEYNEYKHGAREEAIIASIRPFFTKMGSALVVVITSASYMIFGVTGYTNQISDLESAAASGSLSEADKLAGIANVIRGVQGGQSTGLLLCMVIVPFVLMFLSYILYKKHYILDEEEYDRICREIAARKKTA